jgi:hypothetical protein
VGEWLGCAQKHRRILSLGAIGRKHELVDWVLQPPTGKDTLYELTEYSASSKCHNGGLIANEGTKAPSFSKETVLVVLKPDGSVKKRAPKNTLPFYKYQEKIAALQGKSAPDHGVGHCPPLK